jgi:ABC-2 type transport system permease protein
MNTTAEDRAAALAREPMRPAAPLSRFFMGTLQSLRDLVAQRELLSLLVRRELKARYKDSSLGFIWSLMRPLTLLLIYVVALGQFLGASRSIPEFAIFVYTGLTAWTLFNEIVLAGTGSIVANSGLIKKVYLPREVFPLSVVGSALFNFAIQMAILLAATAAVRQFPLGGRWVYFVLSFLVILVYATALALVLSAVNVYLRDVQYLVEMILMIIFWASPAVYSWSLVHKRLKGGTLEQIYTANPVTQAVLGFQKAFWVAGDGQAFPAHLITSLSVCVLVGFVFLWLCQRIFARLQSNFAQEL